MTMNLSADTHTAQRTPDDVWSVQSSTELLFVSSYTHRLTALSASTSPSFPCDCRKTRRVQMSVCVAVYISTRQIPDRSSALDKAGCLCQSWQYPFSIYKLCVVNVAICGHVQAALKHWLIRKRFQGTGTGMHRASDPNPAVLSGNRHDYAASRSVQQAPLSRNYHLYTETYMVVRTKDPQRVEHSAQQAMYGSNLCSLCA